MKDELVAKQTVYMSMLLEYLEAYRAKGLNIPARQSAVKRRYPIISIHHGLILRVASTNILWW